MMKRRISALVAVLLLIGCSSKEKEASKDEAKKESPPAAGGAPEQKSEEDELSLEEIGEDEGGGQETSPGGFEDLKAALGKGEVKAIEEEVARILAKDKKDIKALNALAVFHFQKGNRKAARTVLQRAFENQPEHPALYNNLGLVLAGEGSVREAIIAFRKAIKLDPQHWGAHRNLADLYVRYGDYQRAAPLYEAVAANGSLEENAQVNRALVLWKTGKAAQARELYASLYKTAGGRDFLYAYAAFLVFELKDYKTAQEVVEKLKKEKLNRQGLQMVSSLEKEIGKKVK